MKVSDLAEGLSLTPLCGDMSREITGCYVGDLLSWVMSHAKSGNAWITIMSNINVVAVGSLTDVACVILAEGVEPDEGVLEAAKSKEVCLLKSGLPVYETAAAISNIL